MLVDYVGHYSGESALDLANDINDDLGRVRHTYRGKVRLVEVAAIQLIGGTTADSRKGYEQSWCQALVAFRAETEGA